MQWNFCIPMFHVTVAEKKNRGISIKTRKSMDTMEPQTEPTPMMLGTLDSHMQNDTEH